MSRNASVAPMLAGSRWGLRILTVKHAAELSQFGNYCPFVAKSMIYQRGGLPNVRSFGHARSAELVKGSRHVPPMRADKKATRIGRLLFGQVI